MLLMIVGISPKDVVFGKPMELLDVAVSPDVLCGIARSTDYPELRLELDHSVCNTTDRVFKVGDIYALLYLKRLVFNFGLKWNFVV